MITEYIQAALNQARYKIIEDKKTYFGEIPELEGVWATGKTLEECREELQSTLEDWLLLGLKLGHSIPSLGGTRLL